MSSRCIAMRSGMRCSREMGHVGMHRSGASFEWWDRHKTDTGEVCGTTLSFEGEVLSCEDFAGHRSAHRSRGMVWTDVFEA